MAKQTKNGTLVLVESLLAAYRDGLASERRVDGAEANLIEFDKVTREVKSSTNGSEPIFYTYGSISNMAICITCGMPTYFVEREASYVYFSHHYRDAKDHQSRLALSATESAKMVREHFTTPDKPQLLASKGTVLFPKTRLMALPKRCKIIESQALFCFVCFGEVKGL